VGEGIKQYNPYRFSSANTIAMNLNDSYLKNSFKKSTNNTLVINNKLSKPNLN
jgi:hypothetical protein